MVTQDGPGDPDTSAATTSKQPKEKRRKERVLHTRIPAVLEQELKAVADDLRVPVSNLVRTILEDAVTAAVAVGKAAEEELRGAAVRLSQDRDRLRDQAAATGEAVGRAAAQRSPIDSAAEDPTGTAPPPEVPQPEKQRRNVEPETGGGTLDGVLGFQPLILAIDGTCSICSTPLSRGDEAYLGIRDGPGPPMIIGPECLPKK